MQQVYYPLFFAPHHRLLFRHFREKIIVFSDNCSLQKKGSSFGYTTAAQKRENHNNGLSCPQFMPHGASARQQRSDNNAHLFFPVYSVRCRHINPKLVCQKPSLCWRKEVPILLLLIPHKVIKKTNYVYTRGGMKRKHYGEFKRKPSTVFLIQYLICKIFLLFKP